MEPVLYLSSHDNMSEIKHQIADLLLLIEAELRRLQLWEQQPPALARLQSPTPFCADTLDISQWLQWIFVPRMITIVEQGLPLPQQCDIHSYAEETLQRATSSDTTTLLRLLREFDQAITTDAKSGGCS